MKMIKWILLILGIAFSFPAVAVETSNEPPPSPWFTGPLLAPTGVTYPKGHIGFQPYLFYTDDFGVYNRLRKRDATPNTTKWNPLVVIFIGLGDRTDLQLDIPYLVTDKEGASSHGIADTVAIFGYQMLKDIPHTWIPALKLTLGEAFPTGRFENLNPGLRGTDAMGAGSFQTKLAATFQKLLYLGHGHFLRGRWNFTYTIPANVRLHGFNSFGGSATTNGTINLGNHFSTDLAFEFTITRNWVPAIDFLYTHSDKNSFSGIRGTTPLGLPAPISTASREEFSLAPAMEYNFNSSVGIIAGYWFSVEGRNADEFDAFVFSIVIGL